MNPKNLTLGIFALVLLGGTPIGSLAKEEVGAKDTRAAVMPSHKLTGTVESFEASTGTLKVKEGYYTSTMNLGDDCSIMNGSKPGNRSEIAPGTSVVAHYRYDGAHKICTSLELSPAKGGMTQSTTSTNKPAMASAPARHK
jgi:hypothetical protein